VLRKSLASACTKHGITQRDYYYSTYCWMDRYDADKRLHAYQRLKFKLAQARATGEAHREPAVVGPANLMRARRCMHCNGLKVTEPTSNWIYCDYCARLIDYDSLVSLIDPLALDSDLVDSILSAATHDAFQRAIANRDRPAYDDIVGWHWSVRAELTPKEVSPRVKDPSYLPRLLEASWRWDLALHNNDAHEARAKQFQAAGKKVREHGFKLAEILNQLALGKHVWSNEAKFLAEVGFFEVHPDGVTPEMFLSNNISVFIRPMLGMLDDDDQKKLLAAAGQAHEFLPAPKVDFARRDCARCGAGLDVPNDAKRAMCASCGIVTELGARRFECGKCGDTVDLVERGDSICASCGVSWAR